jgi:hypothetical protein
VSSSSLLFRVLQSSFRSDPFILTERTWCFLPVTRCRRESTI